MNVSLERVKSVRHSETRHPRCAAVVVDNSVFPALTRLDWETYAAKVEIV